MPGRVSEAIVLRTYPLKEADLVVSFFARDQGKLRGVARAARRPKNRFGAGLQRLAHVRMSYFQRENRELVNLDSCELIHSHFGVPADYRASVALDYVAEVSEQLLPPAEANEKFFRLLLAVLEHIRGGGEPGLWRALTYFSLWAVRLGGFLPELEACAACGTVFAAAEAGYFSRSRPGLLCRSCRAALGLSGAWELHWQSRAVVREMLRKPVVEISGPDWTRETAADLRRFLVFQLEEHAERKLLTASVLEAP